MYMVEDTREPEQVTPKYVCEYDGCFIFEGDTYYDIDGFIICEECLDDYLKNHKKRA